VLLYFDVIYSENISFYIKRHSYLKYNFLSTAQENQKKKKNMLFHFIESHCNAIYADIRTYSS